MKKILKKTWAVFLILTLIAIALAGCGGTNEEGEETGDAGVRQQVYFITGSQGGVYQIVGSGMSKVINEAVSDIELVPTTPSQMTQAPVMMQNKEAYLSIAMTDTFERAYAGIEEYEGNACPDIMPILALYDNINCFAVLKDSKYNSIEDLAKDGKKIRVSTTASNSMYAQLLLETAGVDPKNIDLRIMSYAQGSEALGDGNVDVAQFTGYPKNSTIESLEATKGAKLLTVSEETRTAYDAADPLRKMAKIPAGTYEGQTEDVWHSTVYTTLYANKELSEDVVYEIIDACIKGVDEISLVHPAAKDITLETSKRYIEDGIMPMDRLHPGAVKYFKEAGIIQ